MEGYSKFASLMGAYPETPVFRRFGAMSPHNLLYIQAELMHLEHELQECTLENERSGDTAGRSLFSKDWSTLAHFNDGTERQWSLMLKIRAKLISTQSLPVPPPFFFPSRL